jgi:hypothetical protein
LSHEAFVSVRKTYSVACLPLIRSQCAKVGLFLGGRRRTLPQTSCASSPLLYAKEVALIAHTTSKRWPTNANDVESEKHPLESQDRRERQTMGGRNH